MNNLSKIWEKCNSYGITGGATLLWFVINIALFLMALANPGKGVERFSIEFFESHGYGFITNAVLSLLVVGLPSYIKQQLIATRKEIKEEFTDHIKLCPRMTVFHTKDNVLENKLDILNRSRHHKWLLSKFMSQMLTYAFKEFSFKISSRAYAELAKDFLCEANEKVTLSSSYSPYTWLSELSSDDYVTANEKLKRAFFNNEIEHYPIGRGQREKLHSYYLSNLASIKSERYVLLSRYDWDNLYLAERYLSEYHFYNTNNGKEGKLITYYIDPTNHDLSEETQALFMDEVALYDKSLLLKYSPKIEKLLCIPDQRDVENAEAIFEQVRGIAIKYDQLEDKIINDKIKLLDSIIGNNLNNSKIPHAFLYRFKGADNWEEYCRVEADYMKQSNKILEKGLSEFIKSPIFSEDDQLDIVEIGPGTGDKISNVFDILGKKIRSYKLIDVSEELLKKSEKVLKEQKIDLSNIEVHLMDIFDTNEIKRDKLRETLRNSFVIIQANSSLFTEDDSCFEIFNETKAVFLTLDMYGAEKNHSRRDFYYQQHIMELLLHPLRAFEVPIHTNIIKEQHLLCVDYDNNNRLKVIFKLKDYISHLDNEQKLMLSKKKPKNYKDRRNDLLCKNDLIVFDSLKFKDENSIVCYFKKLGFNVIVVPEKSTKCDFVAILLTKKME
jgi:hypothetical protein